MRASIWRKYVSTVERITDFGMAIGCLCIFLIVLLVFGEITSRTLFSFSNLITDEVSGYLMVGAVFAGAAYTLRTGGIIRVELVYEKIPKKPRTILDIIISAIVIIYLLVLLKYSWSYAYESFRLKSVSTSILEMPLWIPQFIMTLGVLLLLLQLTVFFGEAVRKIVNGDFEGNNDNKESGGDLGCLGD